MTVGTSVRALPLPSSDLRRRLGGFALLRGWPPAVRLSLFAQYFNVTFTAIMLGALFDAYMLIKGGSNEFVGTVESVRGVVALLFALPLGCAGDHWPKPLVLRRNAVLGLTVAAGLVVGIPMDAVTFVVVCSVLQSIHNQCIYALLPAFLAELTEAGAQRTQSMSNLQTAASLGNASGPAVQIVLMLLLGQGSEGWSVSELHWVLCSGFLFVLAYVPMICRATSLATEAASPCDGGAGDANASGSSAGLDSPLQVQEEQTSRFQLLVATLCETCSLVTAIGSGMTFKYWPLFFKGDFGFSPLGVCIMQLSIWISIAGTAQLAPLLGQRIGRLPAALTLHVAGTSLLFMISIQSLGVHVEVPLVLLRNALMNSGAPLIQALILESVPKAHRGKWSSIASLRRMTWSGSAFIGGLLSDTHDYRYAFFITACVHSVSGLILALVNLLWRLRPPTSDSSTG